MKTMLVLSIFCVVFVSILPAVAEKPSAEAVKAITKKVADWQIETFDRHGEYRSLPGNKVSQWRNRNNYHDLTWHMGALYVGMNEWRKLSGDPDVEAFLIKIGDRNGWKLHKRPYHADDHTVGQFYLSLYEEKRDPNML